MIIEMEKKASVLDKKADAILAIVDSSGRDVTGILKYWLDIFQVIEMMALCKELTPDKVLNFELDRARLYVVTKEGLDSGLMRVLEMAEGHDVSTINVPDIEEVSSIVWGMESESQVVIRLCRV